MGGAADLDFVPGLLLGDPGRFHHLYTHSIGFALLAGAVAAAVVSRHRLEWGLLAAAAYASHLLLDYATHDPSPPHGIPLLWPLLDGSFASPIPLLPRVLHSSVSVFNLHNFAVSGLEFVLFGALLLVVFRWTGRADRRGKAPASPGAESPDR